MSWWLVFGGWYFETFRGELGVSLLLGLCLIAAWVSAVSACAGCWRRVVDWCCCHHHPTVQCLSTASRTLRATQAKDFSHRIACMLAAGESLTRQAVASHASACCGSQPLTLVAVSAVLRGEAVELLCVRGFLERALLLERSARLLDWAAGSGDESSMDAMIAAVTHSDSGAGQAQQAAAGRRLLLRLCRWTHCQCLCSHVCACCGASDLTWRKGGRRGGPHTPEPAACWGEAPVELAPVVSGAPPVAGGKEAPQLLMCCPLCAKPHAA
jgi:hypothetical protein